MVEDTVVSSYRKLQQLTGEGIIHSGEYRILIVDDSIYDAELMLRELRRDSQVYFLSKTVTNRAAYKKALTEFKPDIVYCDFHISFDFNAVSAVKMLKHEYPEVPFILVTGTLNEEVASICVYEGIDDYVLKSNLSRIQLSLLNAIKMRKVELQKKQVYERLVKSESEVRSFAKHLNKVLEDERARLAREIHDELGQQLAGIKLSISTLRKHPAGKDSFDESIRELLSAIDATIQDLRKIATELRPGILDSLGLAASLQWLVMEFNKKNAVVCQFSTDVEDIRFSKSVSIGLFRICQEALTNISKHSGATEAGVELIREGGNLQLKIHDNGKGIHSGEFKNPFSTGLLGMRERVKDMGAKLNVESGLGKGTMIIVTGVNPSRE